MLLPYEDVSNSLPSTVILPSSLSSSFLSRMVPLELDEGVF
jgi:hypothetical protein